MQLTKKNIYDTITEGLESCKELELGDILA